MAKTRTTVNLQTAASHLRDIILAAGDGELLGSEEEIIAQLQVSRPTLRQVARLLEREGLLSVKRGVNGGYFAARPRVEDIEASVSAYLQMIDADYEEINEVASALWVLVVRKAANLSKQTAGILAQTMRGHIHPVSDKADLTEIVIAEEKHRREIFNVVNSPYIELIFQINTSFASSHFPHDPRRMDNSPEHRQFVGAWRRAKLLEIEAIANRDQALAELAARHYRQLFYQRLLLAD